MKHNIWCQNLFSCFAIAALIVGSVPAFSESNTRRISPRPVLDPRTNSLTTLSDNPKIVGASGTGNSSVRQNRKISEMPTRSNSKTSRDLAVQGVGGVAGGSASNTPRAAAGAVVPGAPPANIGRNSGVVIRGSNAAPAAVPNNGFQVPTSSGNQGGGGNNPMQAIGQLLSSVMGGGGGGGKSASAKNKNVNGNTDNEPLATVSPRQRRTSVAKNPPVPDIKSEGDDDGEKTPGDGKPKPTKPADPATPAPAAPPVTTQNNEGPGPNDEVPSPQVPGTIVTPVKKPSDPGEQVPAVKTPQKPSGPAVDRCVAGFNAINSLQIEDAVSRQGKEENPPKIPRPLFSVFDESKKGNIFSQNCQIKAGFTAPLYRLSQNKELGGAFSTLVSANKSAKIFAPFKASVVSSAKYFPGLGCVVEITNGEECSATGGDQTYCLGKIKIAGLKPEAKESCSQFPVGRELNSCSPLGDAMDYHPESWEITKNENCADLPVDQVVENRSSQPAHLLMMSVGSPDKAPALSASQVKLANNSDKTGNPFWEKDKAAACSLSREIPKVPVSGPDNNDLDDIIAFGGVRGSKKYCDNPKAPRGGAAPAAPAAKTTNVVR